MIDHVEAPVRDDAFQMEHMSACIHHLATLVIGFVTDAHDIELLGIGQLLGEGLHLKLSVCVVLASHLHRLGQLLVDRHLLIFGQLVSYLLKFWKYFWTFFRSQVGDNAGMILEIWKDSMYHHHVQDVEH